VGDRLRSRHPRKGEQMTRDDILKLAREAGIIWWSSDQTPLLIRFAALVAAAERAACADICDQHASIEGIAQRCAAEIRARNK
jgi:hypothetical protein